MNFLMSIDLIFNEWRHDMGEILKFVLKHSMIKTGSNWFAYEHVLSKALCSFNEYKFAIQWMKKTCERHGDISAIAFSEHNWF